MTDEKSILFSANGSGKTTLRIEVTALSDVGRRRSNNEDSFGYDLDTNIFVVCDGMGGMAAGEVASRMAVEHTLQIYRELQMQEMLAEERLQSAIVSANDLVWHMGQDHPTLRGMGTTLVAACVHHNRIVIGNVGDSRAYFVRNGACVQVTKDHSCKAESNGGFENSDLESGSQLITRAVGADMIVKPDFFVAELMPGDMVLLATDGLTRYMDAEKVVALIDAEDDLGNICRNLIVAAHGEGGEDNVTCLLMRIH